MKVKRYKKVKKNMSFYMNNFGFREPYQILVDGTFCYAALKNKIPIADDIPRYLQGEIKLLTTQCTIIEMENLGKKLGGALLILKKFAVHRCGHEGKPIPATKCLLSMLGSINENHYVVATQDIELREQVRSIPGVPLLYLYMKTPVLEHPSEASTRLVNDRLSGISDFERQRLETMKSKLGLSSKDDKRPRKKKMKGQNPLSCLKKKKTTVQNPNISKDESKIETAKKKRKKIRIPQHVKEELFKNTSDS